ncbi:protein SINE1 [Arachis stenosperma]|uniref:protein SINE1 n=1 Tax=Arachis stenosperma TaxID=217475 RepID=UPI0025ACFD8C|nr:protein SINE1 [Arachis stenosperma]XP_057721905.1 protein SINE1 [Arachis stenosperma]XP_057721906.1 protein SINE1 [Arachis stenosperma]
MGKNLSPVMQQELANLDKDPDSRKSAMKALKSYVKDLDCKAIPVFLAKVSETKETGSLSGEFTISLYEVLARVHQVKIVPMIDSIMVSIVQTLASSAGSFPLHQACSKVVPAIARYGIEPTAPEDKKRHIIHSICKPLCDSLSSSQDSLTSGAALCLKALVDSDNWRFASSEMVNRVCQNVAVALEGKSTQTNAHMGLVMSLVKRNALVVEAYARLLIQSGLRILNAGPEERNSHKRLSAIQMVNVLMKCLDPRSVFSELDLVIEEMEKCQSDKMAFVKGAAFEALQTAKRIATDRKPRYVKSPASVTGSNFGNRDYMEGENSPQSISPESCTIDFFSGYESGSVAESAISTGQYRWNSDYERRSVNRKLWSYENGGVDVSLKDGLFSKVGQENPLLEQSGSNEFPLGDGELSEEFSGFVYRNPVNRISKSTNTSPLRSRSQTTADLINIFETPRKLIQSLQDPSDVSPGSSEKQNRRYRSLSSGNIDWSPTSEFDENGSSDHTNCDCKVNQSDDEFKSDSESVSSIDDLSGDAGIQPPINVVPENKNIVQTGSTGKALHKMKRKLFCGFSFMLLAMATPLIWISSQQDQGHYLVPT